MTPAQRPVMVAVPRQPVPRYVTVTSVGVTLVTVSLGLIYLLNPPARPTRLADVSVVGVIEPVMGWVMLVLGLITLITHWTGAGRASMHGLCAVVHGGYTLALVITVVLAWDTAPPNVTTILSVPSVLCHGSLCLAYWARGWR